MLPVEKVVKISPRGQITLPRGVRELIRSDVVRIVADEETIRIEPVRDLAGSLSRYAKATLSREQETDAAWAEAMRGKHPRRWCQRHPSVPAR